MKTKLNRITAYVVDEDPYLYCPSCGRKEYRLNQAGTKCQSSHPPFNGKVCPGVLTASALARNTSIDYPETFTTG